MRWLRPPRGPGGQDGESRSSRSERRPCMEAEPASCRPSSVFCVWAHLGSARKTASQLTRMASNASSRRRALSLVTLAALLFSAPGRRWLGSTLQAADVGRRSFQTPHGLYGGVSCCVESAHKFLTRSAQLPLDGVAVITPSRARCAGLFTAPQSRAWGRLYRGGIRKLLVAPSGAFKVRFSAPQ